MSYVETIIFVIYLVGMLGVGIYFFFKSKADVGEKAYFLGNRQMGPWVSALSAGASDMSAWSLMGLPASVFALGMGQTWIGVGLLIGYALSWIIEAPRLRRFTIVADDSITIPQYLTNRFKSSNGAIRIMCAVLFLVAYTIYAASSMKACGTLFHTVTGMDASSAMYLSALIIILYTFLGGYSAVCWTDFFQGMLILAALLLAPIVALGMLNSGAGVMTAEEIAAEVPGYWSFFETDWRDIVSGLGWGLGYFGMPHIIVRFMSIKSESDVKKSSVIGIVWTAIILGFGCAVGPIGRMLLGDIADSSTVFIQVVRYIFPAVISGVLLSAILAAAMSSADSQLLAASGAFASDVYKPIIRKNKANDAEMMWAGRLIVVAISIVAVLIASNPNSGTIMGLVGNAWGLFGAAFGPAIVLSLYWKRFNFAGAAAAILVGGIVDILWLSFLSSTGVYEIVPASIAGIIAAVVVTLATPAPSKEVEELFDASVAYKG
ncbi:MAG: sodium/proline symporter [Firmicutes bacterium]|nr:sodium/proline symporter [Bacillota bacterium]